MRTIRELLGNSEKIWLYISDSETWEQFVDMASSEGFRFGSLPKEKWVFGHVVSVHSTGYMGHLPILIWCRSFSADVECPEKIDLGKFINGRKDCRCTETHFSGVISL